MHPQEPQAQPATPTQTPPHPESHTERTTRHLQTCRLLTDLAVTLAKATAAQALQHLTPPEPAQEPATTEQPAPPKPYRTVNPTFLFARLTAVALQCMSLETRIANNTMRPPARPIYRSPDPRRPILTRALHQAAAAQPNTQALREEMENQLDEELAADPQAATPSGTIIRRICNGFAVHIPEKPNPDFPRQALYELLDTG